MLFLFAISLEIKVFMDFKKQKNGWFLTLPVGAAGCIYGIDGGDSDDRVRNRIRIAHPAACQRRTVSLGYLHNSRFCRCCGLVFCEV